MMLSFAIIISLFTPIEAAFFYFIIPSSIIILREILFVASIELLILIWGLSISVSWYPHELTYHGVILRWSNLVCCVLPWELIKKADVQREIEPSGRFGVTFHPDLPEAFFSNSANTNVTLTLRKQVVIPAWLTSKKPVDSIHLSLAEPNQFVEDVRQRLQSVDHSAPTPEVEVLSGNTEFTGLNTRSLLLLTFTLEIPLFLIGFTWMQQQEQDFSKEIGLTGESILFGIGLGTAMVMTTIVILSQKSRIPWFKRWADWILKNLAPFIGLPHPAAIAVLASSAGIGEEVFFRGAMQPVLGLLPTALIFSVIHIGVPRRESIPFFVYILLSGLIFGLLREWGISLSSLIIAHAVTDFFNGIYLKRQLIK